MTFLYNVLYNIIIFISIGILKYKNLYLPTYLPNVNIGM